MSVIDGVKHVANLTDYTDIVTDAAGAGRAVVATGKQLRITVGGCHGAESSAVVLRRV